MNDGPRMPDWHRFVGDFAQPGQTHPCLPTIGIAADKCPCCDERRVLIAAIAEDGHEVNVAVNMAVALDIADRIVASVNSMIEPGERN